MSDGRYSEVRVGVRWIYRFSIRYPKSAILAGLVLTALVAPGSIRLRIRTDGHALVPVHADEIRVDRAIREEFAIEDPIVVLIKTDDANGIFNVHTITLIQTLTDEFEKIEGVRPTDLFSLATEHGHRVRPGTLHVRRFLEPLPDTPELLNRLRDDLRAIKLYTGTLVAYDEQATSILVGVPHGLDRTELYLRIRDLIAAQGDIPEEIHVIGAPVAEALLGTHLLEDLGVPEAILGHRTSSDEARDLALPRSLNELRQLIAAHIGLVPVAIAIMAVVFLVSFRSIAGVALPLVEVGACLAFVFGLMGWTGVPVYLTIAVLPVILTAIGVADEIHVVARYTDELRARPAENHVTIVSDTMTEMSRPIVKTSITTAIGFLSFALSPIAPVQAFGVFTAVGIIFCMVWSLTVIPAWLVLMNPRRLVRRRTGAFDGDSVARPSMFNRLAGVVVRLRFVILALAIVVCVAAPYGIRRIVIQDSWIDGFAPGSEFRQTTGYFNDQFLGTHILLVCVNVENTVLSGEVDPSDLDHRTVNLPGDLTEDLSDLIGQRFRLARPPGAIPVTQPPARRRGRREFISWIETAERVGDHIVIGCTRTDGSPKLALRPGPDEILTFEIARFALMTPDYIHRIADLEAFIEEHREDAVGGVIGTADYVETTNLMARALREDARVIPDNADRIEWVWKQYQRIRGEDRRRQLVTSDYARSLVTVFLKNANFVDTKHLMDDIREYEEEHLNPHGISLEFAGDVAVSQTLIGAIVSTQIRSLMISLVGILIVTSLLGRSFGWGVLCVLPCAFAVLIDFAVMGAVGMPLGVATSMFSGMTLGIGVDYAIHLLERFRLARSRGLEHEAAMTDAVAATGPAIFIDAIAVALGFGVMTLSQVPANARLGALVVLSILGCFVATIVLLPALLAIFVPRQSPTIAVDGVTDSSDPIPRNAAEHSSTGPSQGP